MNKFVEQSPTQDTRDHWWEALCWVGLDLPGEGMVTEASENPGPLPPGPEQVPIHSQPRRRQWEVLVGEGDIS